MILPDWLTPILDAYWKHLDYPSYLAFPAYRPASLDAFVGEALPIRYSDTIELRREPRGRGWEIASKPIWMTDALAVENLRKQFPINAVIADHHQLLIKASTVLGFLEIGGELHRSPSPDHKPVYLTADYLDFDMPLSEEEVYALKSAGVIGVSRGGFVSISKLGRLVMEYLRRL